MRTLDQIDRSIFPLSSLHCRPPRRRLAVADTGNFYASYRFSGYYCGIVDALALLLGKVGARITVYYRREEKTDQTTMWQTDIKTSCYLASAFRLCVSIGLVFGRA